jgi:hypothetical protein
MEVSRLAKPRRQSSHIVEALTCLVRAFIVSGHPHGSPPPGKKKEPSNIGKGSCIISGKFNAGALN